MSIPAVGRPAALIQPDRIWFTERLPLGIQFTERMTGWYVPTVTGGAEPIECTLTILADDLERMLHHWRHEARLVGTVTAPALADGPLTVTHGRFRLFQVVQDRVETRRMWYRMRLTSRQGRRYYLCGFKEIRNSPPFNAWSDLTTLAFAVFDGDAPCEARIRGRGVLRISLGDFLRQLTTIRARNDRRFMERLDGHARFVGFFAATVFNTYGRALATSTVATPDPPPPRAPRRRRLKDYNPIPVTTSDGVKIQLTRYLGGPEGPVMLVPGFGITAASFDTPTVETNLVRYLCERHFDVWLLDYRGSPAVPAAWTSFSIDDIARRDYPAAVQKVLECTNRNQVKIVAHCFGSVSLFMSLLDGQLEDLVHSVVASQIAAHPVAALATKVKSGLYLPTLLQLLGVRDVSASFNPRAWWDWIFDHLLKLYPTRERCNNPICRRLLFFFHEIYRHEQLNTETHDALWQWVGVSSMDALKHLSLIVRTGHVVDAEGQDLYLRHDDPDRHREQLRRLALPISFMHGKLNHVFPPEATILTREALSKVNDPRWYRREEFPGYNHFDCFVGRSAARDVFPWILTQLRDPPHP